MNLDLPAYLARVGFEGRPRVDLETLGQLTLKQPQSIAFENLDPLLGRPVSLRLADVEEKLVRGGRGGWCFEHNLLLGEALRAIGFQVQDLAARVLWGREALDRPARTHRLLQVTCEGRRWLVDSGFGAMTPTGALDLESREIQQTPHEAFRLRPLEDDLLLEGLGRDATGKEAWLALYRFDLAPQWPVDFEAVNFQLGNDPASRFVTHLRVARPTPAGRHALSNRELAFWARDGRIERRQIEVGELRQVLQQIFAIDTAGLSQLEQRFAALV